MLCDLNRFSDNTAVVEGDVYLTYRQLQQEVDHFCLSLPEPRGIFILKADNSLDTLVAYLALLQSKHVIMMADPELSDASLQILLQTYSPTGVIEHRQISHPNPIQHVLSDELALLLSTSGSTGSPKQVALSLGNLRANAQSICQYLPLQASDKTITTLPFHYSYGLSVINTHLLVGASIVFSQDSLVSREFWQTFKQQLITSFAGVPYSYEMLLRLRFTHMDLPSLKYFTLAGGKLTPDKVQQLARFAQEQNKSFYVMYGQTEATARMAYMDQDKALLKSNSIGKVIPQGEFKLVDENQRTITQSEEVGELLYRGANVMLGYSQSSQELSEFDDSEWLHTGDLASIDEQGDYFIRGRLSRFIKVFGLRINLDEVELWLDQKGLENYCIGEDNKLQIAVKNNNDIKALKQLICQYLQLHHSVVQILSVSELPILPNGKKDYPSIRALMNV